MADNPCPASFCLLLFLGRPPAASDRPPADGSHLRDEGGRLCFLFLTRYMEIKLVSKNLNKFLPKLLRMLTSRFINNQKISSLDFGRALIADDSVSI